MDMSLVHGSVVVGVDGSDAAAAALDWGVQYALREDRQLVVVAACGVPGVMDDFEDIVASEQGLLSIGRAIAREAVQAVREREDALGLTSLVAMGSPANVLLEASETADVVVIGARGRGSVASALLGSVSAVVIRGAHCPVVVVHEVAEPGPGAVVVGVDGTSASTAAVEFAFRRAAGDGLPLTVLHATWDGRTGAVPPVGSMTYAEKVRLTEEQERLIAQTVARLHEKYPDVTVTELYRRGEPVRELVDASRTASLVVVGSRSRRVPPSNVLGSVSRGVVERAECPVALVRP